MIKSTRNVRIALGALLVVIGLKIWTLENSALIGQGGWVRNFYFFVPGFVCIYFGFSYIRKTVLSPLAAERSISRSTNGPKSGDDDQR